MKFFRYLVAICLLGMGGVANADDQVEKRLTEQVKGVLPNAKVTGVKPTPVPGIYEVRIGPSLIYMTGDGHYIFKGDIFDLQKKENLTNTRRAQARVEAFQTLGAENMIEFAPANGKARRTLYVFTDIDCAYCRKMHAEVQKLTEAGIAVRYLAFPRTGLGGDSYKKAVTVWCSADRKQALTEAKLGKILDTKECPNPVKDQFRMGEAMGVHGTPAVYLDNGDELGGYIPAKELIRMLDNGEI